MRWLLASAQHHPTHGGIGTYVACFVDAAIEAGWTVDLITRPSDRLPRGATIHAITTEDMTDKFAARIPTLRRIERIRPYRYALWSRAVARRLLTLPRTFDAIEFVDCQAEGFASLTSSRVRQHVGTTPMVVHAHTPMFLEESIQSADQSRFGRVIYHAWEREALAAADGVLCTSHLLGKYLETRQAPWRVPYPIRAGDDAPSTAERDESILLVGAVQPRKGVDVWARSCNRVLRTRPRAHAFLIGMDTPTGPDGTSMAAFTKQLVDRDYRDRFHIVGALPHAEVVARMDRASLVVVPSRFESFSFVAAEALDRGTPIIVSDGVGIAEHVSGLERVPVDDVEALAAAQIAVLESPRRSAAIAIAARATMLRTCSAAEHLRQRVAFIEALPAPAAPADNDGLDRLDAFVASIEAEERAASVLSSATS